MKYLIPALAALAVLAGCDRPATTSTTVVKEPATVQKETVVQRDAPPAPSTNVTIDASKPATTTETTKSTTTVDTPAGSATKTETTTTTK